MHHINNSFFKLNKPFNYDIDTSVVHPPSTSSSIMLKGDSGATNHYLSPDAKLALNQLHRNSSIKVSLPDASILTSTHSGFLNIPQLSPAATAAHILPGLLNNSLLSLGQLADDNCLILLSKKYLHVFKNFELILQGLRNTTDGLWDVPLPSPKIPALPLQSCHKANVITPIKQHTHTLIHYLHAALFSPAKSTLLKAINNNHFIGWPGLTSQNIAKFLHDTPATAKGHLDQHKKNLQSTKGIESFQDTFPDKIPERLHQVVATIVTHTNQDTAYFDLTGAFPYASNRGNKYVFILYDFDSNAILAQPIKSRNAADIKKAWITQHQRLRTGGVTPSTYIMDNEAAADLKQAILKHKIQYQLTPPHIHRINAAERAIRTFKNHFTAGLATVDPNFPIKEWDRLIPQAEITLNLLRSSRINPKLSAYAILNGIYDFNKHPIAPPGTKVIVHLKTNQRESWGFHGEDGFYVGPALEHYRCVQCFLSKTKRLRISDTVQFFPHSTPFPQLTLTDRLTTALDEIVSTLSSSHFQAHNPTLTIDNHTRLAIQLVATILHRMAPKPPSVQPLVIKPPLDPAPPPKALLVSPAAPRPALPRVKKRFRSKMHPHTRLKRRACLPVVVQPYARSIINRLLHIYNKQTGKKETLRSLLKNVTTNPVWSKAASNEYGRLMRGNNFGTLGTETMEPIARHDVPAHKQVTYGSMVCDHRPLKKEPNRCRLVVGGDRLTYDHETAAPAANLLEAKLMINSTISTKDARFLTIDIKDFFLSSLMPQPEYMKMHWDEIPPDIQTQYSLRSMVDSDGYVHFRINKGMYGLKQAAILAYNQLKTNLAPHGYRPIPNSVGMWTHDSKPIQFCLCVDDFGIKYQNKQDVEHLITTLKHNYNITIDWSGRNYCGLTLDWDYHAKHVDISMPGYIHKLLTRLAHPPPRRPRHAPHAWAQPVFGRHIQSGTPSDTSPMLPTGDIKTIQSIVGALLYYTRAVDPSMYPALNEISTNQSQPTANTLTKCHHLLDYVSTHPNATIRYHASDMVLNVDSDAAYLVLPRARSHLAGHFFLSSPGSPTRIAPPNGPVLTECKTIRHVVSSAAEAETAALFHNA